MKIHRAVLVGLGIVAFALAPATVVADFWDDFSDGWYDHWTDPNHPNYGYPNNLVELDPCNPDWWVYDDLPGFNHVWWIGSDSVIDKGLLLSVNHSVVIPGLDVGFIAAFVDDYDYDPNTSVTWFDDSTDHYILAYIYYPDYYDPNDHDGYNDPNYDPNYDDPNDDKGNAFLLVHADDTTWHTFTVEWVFHNMTDTGWPSHWNRLAYGNMESIAFDYFQPEGTPSYNFRRIWIDPQGIRVDPNTGQPDPTSEFRDPNDTTFIKPQESTSQDAYVRDPNYDDASWYGENVEEWDRTGLWMLGQFETNYDGDANVLNDPHGKWLGIAVWRGDKYDWNGKWLQRGELSSRYASGTKDPNIWYWHSGFLGLATMTDADYGGGNPAAAVFDNIEVRTGKFTAESHTLTVSFYHGENGSVTIDPDPLSGADPNLPRSYSGGTEVTLTAEPNPGKIFLKWKVAPGVSAAYEDSNSVTYLTLDEDFEVECQFKCGSSVPPFVAMTLLALAVGVVIRRRLL